MSPPKPDRLNHDGAVRRKPFSKEAMLASIEAFIKKEGDRYFVIEELLASDDANPEYKPVEYCIYVFGGRSRFIRVLDRNSFETLTPTYYQQGYFSPNWVPSPYRVRREGEFLTNFRRPARLEEMITIAERVGRGCGAFVRVDCYDSADGVRMGEVTAFAEGGRGFTEFGDLIFSQIWEAFPDREIPLYRIPEKRPRPKADPSRRTATLC